jgi:hypothetical protein
LQLRVLRFGLLQDEDVGVGFCSEHEEIFVSGENGVERIRVYIRIRSKWL